MLKVYTHRDINIPAHINVFVNEKSMTALMLRQIDCVTYGMVKSPI